MEMRQKSRRFKGSNLAPKVLPKLNRRDSTIHAQLIWEKLYYYCLSIVSIMNNQLSV